jgi:DNA-directed RNA polymerase sigma subunit (sigma70/sigma32)
VAFGESTPLGLTGQSKVSPNAVFGQFAYTAGVADDPLLFDDPVAVYLNEIAHVPPLDLAEEMECIKQVRSSGPKAEDSEKRLVETHLGLVVSIAGRYAGGSVHILDLIQSGNTALLDAVRNLGDFHDDRFSNFATLYIERAITEANSRHQI